VPVCDLRPGNWGRAAQIPAQRKIFCAIVWE
jgi:hypothetical protein